MAENDTDDADPHGAIPLNMIQNYLNFHWQRLVRLFGCETSTNVANATPLA
jgi:hypothetical protein